MFTYGKTDNSEKDAKVEELHSEYFFASNCGYVV